MAKSTGYHPGDWYVVCDVCGFRYHASELRKRWDGLMVCDKDYEIKHPQLNIVVHPEKIVPDYVRVEPDDTFINVCTIITSSAYADLGVADCMKADNTTFTYQFLLNLNRGP